MGGDWGDPQVDQPRPRGAAPPLSRIPSEFPFCDFLQNQGRTCRSWLTRTLLSPILVFPSMILGSQKLGLAIHGQRLLLTGIPWTQRTVEPLSLIGGVQFNELRQRSLPLPTKSESSGRTRSRVLGPDTTARLLEPICKEKRLHSLTQFSFWRSPSCRAPELGGLSETLESNMLFPELSPKERKVKSKVTSCSALKQQPSISRPTPPTPARPQQCLVL